MRRADRMWVDRAKRRWGWLITWSLSKGVPVSWERSAALHVALWAMQADRRLWSLERRMGRR